MIVTTTTSTAELIALGNTARLASYDDGFVAINPNSDLESWGDVVANIDGLDTAEITQIIGYGEYTHIVSITDANGDKFAYAVAP